MQEEKQITCRVPTSPPGTLCASTLCVLTAAAYEWAKATARQPPLSDFQAHRRPIMFSWALTSFIFFSITALFGFSRSFNRLPSRAYSRLSQVGDMDFKRNQ
jgi:hypothetical protein